MGRRETLGTRLDSSLNVVTWSCFHSNHGGGGRHTDPEIRRGEGRFQKFLSTLWASVWSKNKEGAWAGLCRITLYSEIRCIALCVLHIVGFSVSSIILADLLGNTCLLKGHGLWFVIGEFRSVLFVSCFKVRCFVIVLFRAIIDYRLVNFAFSFLSLARIKQCLPPSFDKKSTHHFDFLRCSWAV